MIGTSAGNTQKELLKLEKEGILKSTKKVNLRIFSLDNRYPLCKELKRMIEKTLGIECELKKTLKNMKGLEFAFIFGSYVKGDFKNLSDVDLFLIGDVDEDDLITKIQNVEKNTNREIDFHIAKSKEFSEDLKKKFFYQEIVKNYILLTENDDEFKKLIERSGKARQA
jgi:predicted nucleotidyltransferase